MPETNWIRVDSGERPEDKDIVLVISDNDVRVAQSWKDTFFVLDFSGDYYNDDVAHWAHLPEPPKEEK